MKITKKKTSRSVIFPTKKDYSILELIELGEKNNKIELVETPRKNDSDKKGDENSSEKR